MIGKRNRYIDIQTVARSGDSIGGRSSSYTSAQKVFAKVTPLDGTRLIELGQASDVRGYEIEIPYYLETTIDSTVRIVYDSRTLAVQSVIDIDEANNKRKIIAFEKS